MLTAIGRASARRVLAPGRSVIATRWTQPKLATASLTRGAMSPVRMRALTVSAWMRSPTGTKTPATKKKSTKKKPAAKTKKPAPKKKKAAAKKTLTPEEKQKAEIRMLKTMALLKGPQLLPDTAWSVFVSKNVTAGPGKLSEKIKEVSSRFGELSVSEKDNLSSTAQSNSSKNRTTREQWVASYPVEAVYMANIARRRLGRKLDKKRVYLIHDERLPKRAGTPYTLFIKERFAGANYPSGSSTDAFRAISQEWKALSDLEKQPYVTRARAETQRSQAELRTIKDKAKVYWRQHDGGSPAQVPS